MVQQTSLGPTMYPSLAWGYRFRGKSATAQSLQSPGCISNVAGWVPAWGLYRDSGKGQE